MVRCPTPAAPSRYGPLRSGRNRACSTIRPSLPQPTPGGTPSHQVSAGEVRCSVRSTVPDASTNSTWSPGSPVTGSRSDPGGGNGTSTQVWHPSATSTSAFPASRLVSAAAGVDRAAGATTALPPPWIVGFTAPGPSTASRRMPGSGSGSTPVLLSRTKDAAVALRSKAGSTNRTAAPARRSPFSVVRKAPTRRARRSRRMILSSSTSSGTMPSATACASCSPHGPPGPGIDRSSVASALAAVLRAALQSEMTTPGKPHSPFSTSLSRRAFSVIEVPLTLL